MQGLTRVALAAALVVGQATAQPAPTAASLLSSRDTLRRLEQRRDQNAAEGFFGTSAKVRPGTDFGGWSSVTFLDASQLDHNARVTDPLDSVFVGDLRLWGRHVYNARKNVFIRFRKVGLDIDTQPGLPSLDVRTKEQFDLDLAHFEFPVGATQVRVGRLFTRVGRGLVLSDTLDGGRFEYRSSAGLALAGSVGSTIHRADNVDTNVAGFDQGHNDRTFITAQVDYVTAKNHKLTGYFVDENDNTIGANPTQDPISYRYDTQFLGFGAEGGLSSRTVYGLELVSQTGGAGTANGGVGKEKIQSNAALLSLQHRLDGESLPTLLFDYGFGSGEKTRLSVTDSGASGPALGAGDQNFLYFGRYDGGLALQPRLSNLSVVRAGFQLKPLAPRLAAPTDLLTGFKFSSYTKQRGAAPISDPLANSGKKDVGIGFDVFAAWKMFSDVDVLFEYGAFKPGNAYPIGANDESHKAAVTATIAY